MPPPHSQRHLTCLGRRGGGSDDEDDDDDNVAVVVLQEVLIVNMSAVWPTYRDLGAAGISNYYDPVKVRLSTDTMRNDHTRCHPIA